MKNIKYIIGILIILLIILVVILINIGKIINNIVIEEEPYDNTIPQDTEIELQNNVHKEVNDYKFFGINDFIVQFLEHVNSKNSKIVYNLLDDEYKNQNNIEDIIKNINKNGKFNNFYMQELYKREFETNYIYYAKGVLEFIDNQEQLLSNMYFQIYIDNNNRTAAIKILTEEQYEQEIVYISNNVNEKIITKNENNNYEEPILTNYDLAQRYIRDYIFKLQNDIEQAFYLLDTDYRENQFNNNLEIFKQYIQENKEKLYDIKIYECNSQISNDYIQYIIKDFSGNTYVIKRKNVMDYSIILESDI